MQRRKDDGPSGLEKFVGEQEKSNKNANERDIRPQDVDNFTATFWRLDVAK